MSDHPAVINFYELSFRQSLSDWRVRICNFLALLIG